MISVCSETRIAQIYSSGTASGLLTGVTGSGWLLGGCFVLTARHCVCDSSSTRQAHPKIQVNTRAIDDGEKWLEASLVWPSSSKDWELASDLALLRVDGFDEDVDSVPSLGLFEPHETEIIIHSTGFPRFTILADKRRETHQINGIVKPRSGLISGTFEIHNLELGRHADRTVTDQDDWSGFSGAALFAGTSLIGVITIRMIAGRYDFRAERLDRLSEATVCPRIIKQRFRSPRSIDKNQISIQTKLLYDVIDLTALAQPGTIDPNLPRPMLSKIFIPQFARLSRPAQSLPRDYLLSQLVSPDSELSTYDTQSLHWFQSERRPILQLLQSHIRLKVVLGDPGMGKSSLARYLAIKVSDEAKAEEWIGVESASAQRPWGPISNGLLECASALIVEIREFAGRRSTLPSSSLLDYLSYMGVSLGYGYSRSQLEYSLLNERILIIFDGLDELFEPHTRRTLVQEIIGFASTYKNAEVLVTSRIAGFDAHPFESAGARILTLDDLDDSQISMFSEVWFSGVFGRGHKDAQRAHEDLTHSIREIPAIASLAKNPMLLTIMAIICQHERLSRSRIGLYAQALKVLCYSWEFRKELTIPRDSPLRDLTPEDKNRMLRAVARQMQGNANGLRGNVIVEKELKSCVESFFRNEWHFDTLTGRRAASEMIELLQIRNWILTLRGPALFGFVHRTFLEYLCALDVVERFKDREIEFDFIERELIESKMNDDSWSEIICLIVAQMPSRYASRVVELILQNPSGEEKRSQQLCLAIRCIGEQDARKLSLFSAQCDAAISKLFAELGSADFVRRTDAKLITQLASAFNAVAADWPDTKAANFCPPNLHGSAVRDLVEALLRSVWSGRSYRQQILQSMVLSAGGVCRVVAIRCLLAEFGSSAETKAVVDVWHRLEDETFVRSDVCLALAETLQSGDPYWINWLTRHIFGRPISKFSDELLRAVVLVCSQGRNSLETCSLDDIFTQLLKNAKNLDDHLIGASHLVSQLSLEMIAGVEARVLGLVDLMLSSVVMDRAAWARDAAVGVLSDRLKGNALAITRLVEKMNEASDIKQTTYAAASLLKLGFSTCQVWEAAEICSQSPDNVEAFRFWVIMLVKHCPMGITENLASVKKNAKIFVS